MLLQFMEINHRPRDSMRFSNSKNGRITVLVATDIAARGIDVDALTHVINYDLPDVPETYVHRIGRTGRAGASGIALSFCDRDEIVNLKDINKLIGQKIPAFPHPYEATGQDAQQPVPPAHRPPQNRNSRQGQSRNRSSNDRHRQNIKSA